MTVKMTRLHRRMTTMLFAKADGAVTAASERQAMPQLSKCGRRNTLLIAIPIKSGQES